MLRALLPLCLIVAGSIALRADDLEALQGAWEMSFQQSGRQLRAVKTIEGNRETVEVFYGDQLLKQHVVDFKLDDSGEVKTFTYHNGRITRGAGAGQQVSDGKFIYRLIDDRWIGVFGVLQGDRGPVYTAEYRRLNAVADEPNR